MSAVASANPFFGRAWSLSIDPLNGQPAIQITNVGIPSDEKDALKVVFSVDRVYWQELWWAEISIYNLAGSTESNILQPGANVSLSAGYQKSFDVNTNRIFQGSVFQPMWERRDVVDYIVTLRCVVGLEYWVQNFVSGTSNAMVTQANVVRQIASQCRNTIPIDQLEESSLQQKLPRSKSYYGRPRDYIEQIATTNSMVSHFGFNGLNLTNRQFDPTTTPKVVYAPPYLTNIPNSQSSSGITKQTLIGTPQQTAQGVNFKVLLDADVQTGDIVKLDVSTIRQTPLYPGTRPGILDQNGLYIVGAVRHSGDTRGNDWHTEITGLSYSFWYSFTRRGIPTQ